MATASDLAESVVSVLKSTIRGLTSGQALEVCEEVVTQAEDLANAIRGDSEEGEAD